METGKNHIYNYGNCQNMPFTTMETGKNHIYNYVNW